MDYSGYRGNWRCDASYCNCAENEFIHVNHDIKVLYYEVPRAASTSFRCMLRDNGFHRIQSKEYDDLIESGELKNYFKFSVKRNPYSRTVSNYKLFTTKTKREKWELLNICGRIQPHISIGEITEQELDKKLPSFSEFILEVFVDGNRNHHWASCTEFHPVNIELDRILEFSRIESEWKQVIGNRGLKLPRLPHKHELKRNFHYSELYTEKWMVDKVREEFSTDIERFGYQFKTIN